MREQVVFGCQLAQLGRPMLHHGCNACSHSDARIGHTGRIGGAAIVRWEVQDLHQPGTSWTSRVVRHEELVANEKVLHQAREHRCGQQMQTTTSIYVQPSSLRLGCHPVDANIHTRKKRPRISPLSLRKRCPHSTRREGFPTLNARIWPLEGNIEIEELLSCAAENVRRHENI